VGNIAGDVKFISISMVFSVLVVVCDYGYYQLPKKGGKIKTIAPEGAILTDTLDKLITAATNPKKDTGDLTANSVSITLTW
jgi:hypothetical protein